MKSAKFLRFIMEFLCDSGIVCPHCDLRFLVDQCYEFVDHVQSCKLISLKQTSIVSN